MPRIRRVLLGSGIGRKASTFNTTYYSDTGEKFMNIQPYNSSGTSEAKILDEIARSLHDHVRTICASQKTLLDAAVYFARRTEFEENWGFASDEQRIEAVFYSAQVLGCEL